MKIHILPEHIRHGERGDPTDCAIARAVRAETHKPVNVGFTRATIGTTEYRMDAAAILFRQKFDGGVDVTPCTIELTKVKRK